MEKNILERLVKMGSISELFGLIKSYKFENVVNKIKLWGLKGSEFWGIKEIEKVIEPYRRFAEKEAKDEKTIDAALQTFANAAGVDINLVRRIFYQIVSKTPEKTPKSLSEEAEDNLPPFDEEETEEEEPEEAEPEEKSD